MYLDIAANINKKYKWCTARHRQDYT